MVHCRRKAGDRVAPEQVFPQRDGAQRPPFEGGPAQGSSPATVPDAPSGAPASPADGAGGRAAAGLRVGLVTIAVNLALVAFKLAAGLAGRSYAVLADGLESLADTATTLGFLAAVRLGDRPPDRGHPYGHRRVESEATRVLTLFLLAGGVLIGWQSARGFGRTEPVGAVALLAAAVSVGAKEWMFWYTFRAGRRLGSRALVASAWHHRSDALSSVVTLLAVAGARVGWLWLDPLAGIAVAAVVVWVAVRLYWSATSELVDAAPSPEIMQRLHDAARRTPGVEAVSNLRARLHGTSVLADLTIHVSPAMSVSGGHEVASAVERSLHRAVPALMDVTVHVEPFRPDGGREGRNAGLAGEGPGR